LPLFAQLAGANQRQALGGQRHTARTIHTATAIRAIQRCRCHPGDHTRSRKRRVRSEFFHFIGASGGYKVGFAAGSLLHSVAKVLKDAYPE
jgi:hypothetical protein